MKFYEIAEEEKLPMFQRHSIKAIKINEFRAPKAGEWYISGAIPEAYVAHSDYDPKNKYAIVKLVKTKKVITTMYEGDL
jgi:hypothetical protein